MEKILNNLLKNLIDKMDNIQMVAIIDRSGLPIASIMATEEEEVISAITSSFDIFIDRMKKEFSGKTFTNIMSMGNRKFYFASTGENAILTIVGSEEAKDTQLKVFGNFAINKIKSIFEDVEKKENISIEIPRLLKVLSKFANGRTPKGEYTSKIIVCGDYKVGKSSLVRRFIDGSFNESYISTLGVDITKKKINLTDSCSVNFLIWDIAGQIKQMAPYRKNFFKGANAAFLVYSKIRKETLDSIRIWLKDIADSTGNIPKVIIGNKNDLSDQFEVSEEDVKNLANEFGLEYIETSCKTGENVEDAFRYMGYRVVQ